MEVIMMYAVTVSPKYQVVIPKFLRELLKIHPGEKMQILPFENRIEFIPMRKMKEMRGFLRGIDTTIKREKDRV